MAAIVNESSNGDAANGIHLTLGYNNHHYYWSSSILETLERKKLNVHSHKKAQRNSYRAFLVYFLNNTNMDVTEKLLCYSWHECTIV